MTLYQWLVAWLVSMSAAPGAVEMEHPRAAAAVAAARASMSTDGAQPTRAPAPAECVCGGTCKNGIWKPDGKIDQRCTCTCERCKKKPAAPCPDGKCPPR